ncbi:MAG: YdcH family protein [Acidobacteria bacterium]|jgi:uncharacterized protein|nr:YdcH family protein [Acidobacteriota bacterium]
MTDTEETRRLLLQSSDVYRQLTSDHHTLDDRLKLLAGKPHLSDDEQLEEVRLKKEKLRLKDQMEAIVRRHQAPVSTRPN